MIQFIICYLLVGLVVGILCLNLTHDSIKIITCDVFGRPIGYKYKNLCFYIIVSSLIVWPIYFIGIIIPRFFCYLKGSVVYLFVFRK